MDYCMLGSELGFIVPISTADVLSPKVVPLWMQESHMEMAMWYPCRLGTRCCSQTVRVLMAKLWVRPFPFL